MNILFVKVEGENYSPGESLHERLKLEAAIPSCRVSTLRFSAPHSAATPSVTHSGDAFSETVLPQPTPLDYGEKIKLGLEFALRNAFDAVIILDGLSRYPADAIPDMARLILQGADMVLAIPDSGTLQSMALGDHITRPGAKFAARLLNLLAKGKLTGWHCGFRAYRTGALREIPFRYNDSSRAFNTEIIIQFLVSRLRIVEMPTPGYRHQEMGVVRKTGFALKMIMASVLSLLHRMNIFYQPQFDVTPPEETYRLKLGYDSSHTVALRMVQAPARILDIGCGAGDLAAEFTRKGCEVHGLDQHAEVGGAGLSTYRQVDLDVTEHAFEVAGFDYILLLDVLEHLRSPEALLDHIRSNCGPGRKPVLVISVPNVAFFIIRLRLLFGTFNYGKLGILDLTHTRLFTLGSITALLSRHGYQVSSLRGVPAPYPKAIGLNMVSRTLLLINRLLISLNKRLFSYQIMLQARPSYTLDDLQS